MWTPALLAAVWAAFVAPVALAEASLVWGTYRPQVFLGMRPQIPDAVLSGLVYFSTRDLRGLSRVRHTTESDDGIRHYGWTHHDGRNFGIQQIVDDALNYRLETSFVKTGPATQPGSWALRIQGTVLHPSEPAELALVYYLGRESDHATMHVSTDSGAPVVHGTHPQLGDFALRFGPGGATHYAGMHVPMEEVWQAQDPIVDAYAQRYQQLARTGADLGAIPPSTILQLPNTSAEHASLFALQRTFTGNFSLDVFLDGTPHASRLDAEQLSVALAHHRTAYETAFSRTFDLRGYSESDVRIARELTAQVVGGIGYFAGASLVDRRPTPDDGLVLHDPSQAEPTREPPAELLTATPSRSFFPRGFYWDEGFHQAHIAAWDKELGLQLFASWTRLIDEDGWVAREQILGAEARSRVPEAFQVQFPKYANPPALILGLLAYLDELRRADAAGGGFGDVSGVDNVLSGHQAPFRLGNHTHADLAALYAPWRRHYAWFRRTQRGQIHQWDRTATAKREAYRWRGRSATHVLTSGLDDYPRAATPHVGELHLDLHAWMGGFARAMRDFALHLGFLEDAEEYARHYEGIRANLYDLHWNEKEQLFCDASVDDEDESYWECHRGYVSLFPLLMGLLEPDAPALGATLDLMGDPKHLWSPHGLRSLSTQHPLYGTEEDYWRSAVWVPINYLALRALYAYAARPGPYAGRAQELYTMLRHNVVRTVLDSYRHTGYPWEQYDADTGAGRRNRPFAGWTSTVVLIMAERYP